MFDPYHKWLGIPREEQPPNHYRLLGLSLFESDADVIDAAANRQMAYVQSCAAGPYTLLSQRLLGDLAVARICLLNPEKKATYDARLRAKRSVAKGASPPPPPISKQVPAPEVRRSATDKRFPVLEGVTEEAEPYDDMPIPAAPRHSRGYARKRMRLPVVASILVSLVLTLSIGTFVAQKGFFDRSPQSTRGVSVPETTSDRGITPSETSVSPKVADTVSPSIWDDESSETEIGKLGNIKKYTENEFTMLFDGHDFEGWVGHFAEWQLDPVRGVMISPGDPHLYGTCTERRFDDFALRFDYRVLSRTKNLWSGLALRHGGQGDSISLVIGDGNSGDLLFKQWIVDTKKALNQFRLLNPLDDWRVLVKKTVSNEKPQGEWNSCEVVCTGPSVIITINGQVVNHVPDATTGSGMICFTQNGTKAEYRNIRIKPIP